MKRLLSLLIIVCTLDMSIVPATAEKAEITLSEYTIHGGVILRNKFLDYMTKLAENNDAVVTQSGNDIAIQKQGKSMAVIGDVAYYMENGVLKTKNLYKSKSLVKLPEEALESVLGADERKSEAYKKTLNAYNDGVYVTRGMAHTPYGTLVCSHISGVMRGFKNKLDFVKWDGSIIHITADAPYETPWSPAKWSKIELSDDGKVLTVTYPANEKRLVLDYGDGYMGRVLWDEGTYVIEADLEVGEVKRYILPLAK